MTEKLYAGQKELSEDNYKKWAKKVGVRGTPTFLMNGWSINERTVEGAKKLIAEKGLLTAGK